MDYFVSYNRKANKNVITLLACFLLTACASNLPQEVKVPIAVTCPTPIIPAKPHLPIADLKPNSQPNTVIKAYAASIKLLQGYSNELIKILQSYQNNQI